MNYNKVDKKIEKEKRKIERRNQKIEQEEAKNKNLPTVEPKGIKKFFKKIGISIGMIVTASIAIFSAEKRTNDYARMLEDNTTGTERETDSITESDNRKASKTLKDLGIDEFDKLHEKGEETQPTIQDELKDLTSVVTPKKEEINIGTPSIENPMYSVETKIENNGKEENEIETLDKTNNEKDTSTKTATKTIKAEYKTTNVTSTGGNVKLETNAKGDDIIITDGTTGTITIEEIYESSKENEDTIEVEEETFENINTFEDDFER